MNRSTLAKLGAVMILVGVMAAPTAFAQQLGIPESTTWSITEPTNVGGTVLQPGLYRIAVVQRPQGRHVIRVMSEDQETTHTTLLTVPHPLEPNEEIPNAMFVYFPTAPGETRILRTWFPATPTGRVGHDIVYQEDYAMTLARASETPVVSFQGPAEEVVELEEPELRLVTPDARVETYTVPDFTPPTRVAVVEEPPAMVREARTELPATSGKMPLVALLGFLTLSAAFVIRAANR